VHRLLTALIAEGIVEQRPRTRRYVVGGQIQLSGLARPVSSPLLSAAVPHLNDAVSELGDTLFLTLRADRETICVARRLGSYPIQVLSLDVGDRRPLGVSSAGIAMLATLRTHAARGIVMGNKRHLPAYGMTVEDALAAVARARQAGYTLRERGLVPGTRAVSVTLGDSEAPAALTIAAITRRMQLARVLVIVDRLRTYAGRIEASLQSAGSRIRSA
jgi:DNA-binding IclR family transcriptional regulator